MSDPSATLPELREWLGEAGLPWPAIRTLNDGEPLQACFLLAGLDLARTRQEKPYLRLQLSDRHGTIEARVWDDAERVTARLRAGAFVGVRGRVQVYRGEHQLRVDEIRTIRVEPEDLGLFLPRSERDADDMETELMGRIRSIRDAPLRRLLRRLLAPDSDTGRAFRQAPAAKRNHHAYVGGLLEHTLSLVAVCDFLAGHYAGDLDRDLLVAGALLHDIGKIRELGVEAGFPYTDEGKLLGHIMIGLQIVAREAERVRDLPPERLTLLLHLIASHQGRYEWQSPREPVTLEALILHYADDLDAKVQQARRVLEGVDAGWTPYDRSFGRELLRHRAPEASSGPDRPGAPRRPGQGERADRVEPPTVADRGAQTFSLFDDDGTETR